VNYLITVIFCWQTMVEDWQFCVEYISLVNVTGVLQVTGSYGCCVCAVQATADGRWN